MIAQSYLWAARHGAGAEAIAPLRATFDSILAKPPIDHLSFVVTKDYESTPCLRRWCWCDALFMSPPAWVELSQQTGDPRYTNFAMAEFWATTDFLYDPVETLYFRDSRFFERRDDAGPQTILEPRQRLGVRRHRQHSRRAAERQSAPAAHGSSCSATWR